MKYFKLILVMVFLCGVSAFSQEKYTKHTITRGETISSIAQKYKVKPSAIYELNPDCRGVLKLKSVLLIPSKNSQKETTVAEKDTKTEEIIHEVQAKETLFGIAKQYGITLTDLNKANPKLETSGLKVGQKINVPVKEGYKPSPVIEVEAEKDVAEIAAPVNETPKQKTVVVAPIKEITEEKKETVVYEVLQNETKYSIAKKYGISVPDLDKANPILETESLKIGQKISIPVKEGFVPAPAVVEKETVKVVPDTVVAVTETPNKDAVVSAPVNEVTEEKKETVVYEVLQNETKYSIAKKYGISVPDLDKANPILEAESLKIGQKINIPVKEGFIPAPAVVVKEVEKIAPEVVVAEKELPKQETVAAAPEKETVKELNEEIIREVLPRETKFGIAKQYGISVEELERQNPAIKRNLPVGFKLTIRNANVSQENSIVEKTATENNNYSERSSFITPPSNIELVDQLIKIASDNIGTRYRSGGTSKAGFDCSGLMCTTFGAFDIKLPRSSFEQAGYGTRINTEDAQKGDLIFFKTNGRRQINHVGMVVEVSEGEIKFIHSSLQKGVIISSTKEKYYERSFSQVNRVLQ
ncbi:Murein DD-endopeptidase MepS/Murein LD-carboxypeptidase precursor [compost metagenome]